MFLTEEGRGRREREEGEGEGKGRREGRRGKRRKDIKIIQ